MEFPSSRKVVSKVLKFVRKHGENAPKVDWKSNEQASKIGRIPDGLQTDMCRKLVGQVLKMVGHDSKSSKQQLWQTRKPKKGNRTLLLNHHVVFSKAGTSR